MVKLRLTYDTIYRQIIIHLGGKDKDKDKDKEKDQASVYCKRSKNTD